MNVGFIYSYFKTSFKKKKKNTIILSPNFFLGKKNYIDN